MKPVYSVEYIIMIVAGYMLSINVAVISNKRMNCMDSD